MRHSVISISAAIPLDIDKLTPQVIDDTLDGTLGETPDDASSSSDLLRGITPHSVLAQADHLRTRRSN